MSDPLPTPRTGGRRAARPPRRGSRALDALDRAATGVERARGSRLPLLGFALLVVAGLASLVAAIAGADARVELGPVGFGEIGAVLVSTAYSWGLAARTGGRPVVFGSLALLLGVVTVLTDQDSLRAGAAVMTAAVGAALGVMATVPAVRVRHALREVVIALATSAVGALAAVGFEPVLSLERFGYLVLLLAFGIVFSLVYRLGAGIHGLGRRGAVMVLVGGVGLALALAYGELLGRYGSFGLIETLTDLAQWSRETFGAFPRPLPTMVGVPALAWGVHQRARRRQGWWACAFGVAGTAPIAVLLADPARGLVDVGLTELYSLLAGSVVAVLVIRADLLLTGSRGRRSRHDEEEHAVRPEPGRTRALL